MSDLLDLLIAQAADGTIRTATFSPESAAVLLTALAEIDSESVWVNKADNPLDEVTPSQWDQIQNMIANATNELLTEVIIPEQIFPDEAFLPFPSWQAGGSSSAVVVTVNSTYELAGYVRPSVLAGGCGVKTRVFIAAGTYNLTVCANDLSSTPTAAQIYIGANAVGVVNIRGGATGTPNHKVTIEVEIAASGNQWIEMVYPTGSPGFDVRLSYVRIWKSGAEGGGV